MPHAPPLRHMVGRGNHTGHIGCMAADVCANRTGSAAWACAHARTPVDRVDEEGVDVVDAIIFMHGNYAASTVC